MDVRNPLIDWEVIRVAREMIEFGGRTQIVAQVTGLSAPKVRALYRARFGRAQKTGNIASRPSSFLGSVDDRLHCTLIASLHEWLAEFRGLRDPDTLLGAYRLYKRVVGSRSVAPHFDINAAYQITRLLRSGSLRMTPCERCPCDFVEESHSEVRGHERSRRSLCPACELLDADRDRAVHGAKSSNPHETGS